MKKTTSQRKSPNKESRSDSLMSISKLSLNELADVAGGPQVGNDPPVTK